MPCAGAPISKTPSLAWKAGCNHEVYHISYGLDEYMGSLLWPRQIPGRRGPSLISVWQSRRNKVLVIQWVLACQTASQPG